jgi:hypothetical protein
MFRESWRVTWGSRRAARIKGESRKRIRNDLNFLKWFLGFDFLKSDLRDLRLPIFWRYLSLHLMMLFLVLVRLSLFWMINVWVSGQPGCKGLKVGGASALWWKRVNSLRWRITCWYTSTQSSTLGESNYSFGEGRQGGGRVKSILRGYRGVEAL